MAKYKITERQLNFVRENLNIKSTVKPEDSENVKTPNPDFMSTKDVEIELKEVIQKVINKFKYIPKIEKENFKKELDIFLSKF